MNTELAEQFAKDWIEAWNSHDLEKIIAHYGKELEFKSPLIFERYPNTDGVISNRKTLKEYFSIGLENNPQLKFHLIDLLIGVDGLVLYYENARGGKTAELFEFNEKGEVIRSTSCYGK